jgi:hypothetical protein
MYKEAGPVNKETQDDFARRSNPSCFRAQEEFRVRLEAGAHPPHQRHPGRRNPAAGLEASKGVISVSYSKDPLDPNWQDDPAPKKYFDFVAKYDADGDKACVRDWWRRACATRARRFEGAARTGAWTGSCALRRPPCVQFQCHDRANWTSKNDAQPTGALQACNHAAFTA